VTLLVTGGAGFIGSNFVLEWFNDAAVAEEPVVTLDALTYAGNLENLASLEGNAKHHFVKGDITDAELVRRLIAEHQPRAIVHFAADSFAERCIRWDDPTIAIQWPFDGMPALSSKDAQGVDFKAAELFPENSSPPC
jgi:dTDP-D-glucose 4,6-dehydratase